MYPKALLVKASLVTFGIGALTYRLNRFLLVLVLVSVIQVILLMLLFLLRGPEAPRASLCQTAAGCALAAGK